jgi:hypothetical protein
MKERRTEETTEYFYFGIVHEDHSRDQALKDPSQALKIK